jgi:hypothetical protein
MKKIIALAAFLLAGISSSANASTLDILLGTPSTYSLSAADLISNVNVSSPQLVPISNAGVVVGSIPNIILKPSNISNATPYLAIFQNGSAQFTPSSSINQFGFTWGSIDVFNTVTISDATHTFSITGSDLAAHIAVSFGTTEKDVLFTDPFGPILSVLFSSSSNSFEVAHLFQGSNNTVPLPGSMILFMTGLVALLLLRRKQII